MRTYTHTRTRTRTRTRTHADADTDTGTDTDRDTDSHTHTHHPRHLKISKNIKKYKKADNRVFVYPWGGTPFWGVSPPSLAPRVHRPLRRMPAYRSTHKKKLIHNVTYLRWSMVSTPLSRPWGGGGSLLNTSNDHRFAWASAPGRCVRRRCALGLASVPISSAHLHYTVAVAVCGVAWAFASGTSR